MSNEQQAPAAPTTSFALVSTMNTAFGNPRGNACDFLPMPDILSETETHFNVVPWSRLEDQIASIEDEYRELMGYPDTGQRGALGMRDLDGVRDGLCDIMIFALGAYHFLGLDADADMRTVTLAVMTRFIKDDADKQATIAKHAAKGVTDVYFEGVYPTMIMKSARAQFDAPKGKFLKSASYREPVFAVVQFPQPEEDAAPAIEIDCKMQILNSHDGGKVWSDIRDYGIQYDCATLDSAKAFLIAMHVRADGTGPVIEEDNGVFSVVHADGKVDDRFMIAPLQ